MRIGRSSSCLCYTISSSIPWIWWDEVNYSWDELGGTGHHWENGERILQWFQRQRRKRGDQLNPSDDLRSIYRFYTGRVWHSSIKCAESKIDMSIINTVIIIIIIIIIIKYSITIVFITVQCHRSPRPIGMQCCITIQLPAPPFLSFGC